MNWLISAKRESYDFYYINIRRLNLSFSEIYTENNQPGVKLLKLIIKTQKLFSNNIFNTIIGNIVEILLTYYQNAQHEHYQQQAGKLHRRGLGWNRKYFTHEFIYLQVTRIYRNC